MEAGIEFVGEGGDISKLESLPTETIIDIALGLTADSVNRLCKVSRKFNAVLCKNDEFWKQKYIHDFGKIKRATGSKRSWRDLYEMSIPTDNMAALWDEQTQFSKFMFKHLPNNLETYETIKRVAKSAARDIYSDLDKGGKGKNINRYNFAQPYPYWMRYDGEIDIEMEQFETLVSDLQSGFLNAYRSDKGKDWIYRRLIKEEYGYKDEFTPPIYNNYWINLKEKFSVQ